MCCRWITYFKIFTRNILHMHFSAVLYHLECWGQRHEEGVWVSSYKHTDPSCHHILRTYDCNKVTIDSITLLIFFHHFLQQKPWLCIGVSRKTVIFCVHYMRIHILMSDDCEAEVLENDSSIPTTPPRKHFQSVP